MKTQIKLHIHTATSESSRLRHIKYGHLSRSMSICKPLVTLDIAFTLLNTYKPSVLFVGHRQTAQTQIRRRRTRRLIGVSTVSLQNVLLKFE